MAVNPNIAMGFRGVELQNPLAQYSQVAAIQNAQNQNALAQYQLGSAQRQDVAQNALNEAYSKNIDPKTGEINFAGVRNFLAGKGAGSQIPGQLKLEREATTAKLAQQKTETELVDAKLKQSRQFLDTLDPVTNPIEAAQQYLSWHEANHRDPILGPALTARGIDPANSRAGIMAAIQKGPQALADAINASKLGNEKFMELNKPSNITVNQGGQTQILQKAGLGGPLTSAGIYADVPLPAAVEEQKKRIGLATRPVQTVNLPPQEKAFEGELGKGQAKSIIDNRIAAQDAASIIDTVKTGRDIMKSGMITGAGADFLVNLNQGLKTAGIDSGYADAAANSQAFTANMAGNVGKLIKQFGAGTGLSDADREFAKDMAGGRISLDAKAINKILDINERAARNVITRHNKDVKGIKTNIPLEVELPPEDKPAPAKNVVTNPQFPGFSIGKP